MQNLQIHKLEHLEGIVNHRPEFLVVKYVAMRQCSEGGAHPPRRQQIQGPPARLHTARSASARRRISRVVILRGAVDMFTPPAALCCRQHLKQLMQNQTTFCKDVQGIIE